eukprot:gene27315-34012_t
MQFCLQPSFDDVLVEAKDGTKKIDVERAKPDKLIPFEVIKATPTVQANEIKPAVFVDLNKNKKIVTAEIKKNSRAIDLMSSGLQGFFAAFRRNHVFNPSWSIPRRRWVRAIRKVIMRNFLAAIKIRLVQSALYVKPQLTHHMVTTGLVVVAKNRFLGMRKRSFCDERLGLSSHSGHSSSNSGAFGYTSSKIKIGSAASGESFGRSSSKTNLASLSQDKLDPTSSNLRNIGKSSSSGSAVSALRIDTADRSQKLVPLERPSSGKKSIGGRKGSFDDSQLKEMGVAARAAMDAAENDDEDDEDEEDDEEAVIQKRLQRQREKESEKVAFEMLDQQDIESVLSIFSPDCPTSPSNTLPPIGSAFSPRALTSSDSSKIVRPRALLIPRSGVTSPTNASSRPDSAAESVVPPSPSSFRSRSPASGRRMSRDRGTPGIDLSAEAFDKLVLGITSSDLTVDTSGKNSPSLPSIHSRTTAAQDARNGTLSPTNGRNGALSPTSARNGALSPTNSLSRQGSKLTSPSSKNSSAKTTPRTPRTPRGGFSRENRAELEGTQYSTASVSNDEYLHDIMSSSNEDIKVSSIGIAAGSLHASLTPELKLVKRISHVPPLTPTESSSTPRTPVIPANTVLITGANKVVTPSSTSRRRASHLSAMKVLRAQQGAGSDSEDATYCSDQELQSFGRSVDAAEDKK